jgi:hypothetical protein
MLAAPTRHWAALGQAILFRRGSAAISGINRDCALLFGFSLTRFRKPISEMA